MPQDDFERTLESVEGNLEKADEQVVDSITAEVEGGEDREGFLVKHGDHDLVVLGAPSEYSFQVSYSFHVVNQFAQRFAISEVASQNPNQPVDVEVQDRHVQQARERVGQILENQDEEKRMQLRQQIVRMLSLPACAYQLQDADDGTILGFQTSRKIWPYEDDFAPSKAHRACQTVISVGLPVILLLQRQFGLGQVIETTEGTGEGITRPEDRTPRGFQ